MRARPLRRPSGSMPTLRTPPKSDISDFGHSIVPNSGKPEFGCVGIEPQSIELASGPARRLGTKRQTWTTSLGNSAMRQRAGAGRARALSYRACPRLPPLPDGPAVRPTFRGRLAGRRMPARAVEGRLLRARRDGAAADGARVAAD